MADEPTQTTTEQPHGDQSPQDQQNQPNADRDSSAATENTEYMIPKSRFDEVNSKAKAEAERAAQLESELAKYKTDQAKAEEEAAAKRGEFEQLYTKEKATTADLTAQLETATAELGKLRELVTQQLNARMNALPDHIKPLIEKMDALEALTYLDENADKFAGPTDATQPRKQPAPPMNGADGIGKRGNARNVTLARPVRF